MKTKNTILTVISAFAAALLVGCGLTAGQQTSALVQAGGQAYGAHYLTSREVNGVVPAAVLAQYEQNLVGVNFVMQGALDPYTFQQTVTNVRNDGALSSDEAGAVGFLSSITGTFIQANSNPLTPEGALAQAEAQQLAKGLAAAVKQVTGTAFTVPVTPPPAQ
jgi:hypothetical protein